jgi:hypothetical protein
LAHVSSYSKQILCKKISINYESISINYENGKKERRGVKEVGISKCLKSCASPFFAMGYMGVYVNQLCGYTNPLRGTPGDKGIKGAKGTSGKICAIKRAPFGALIFRDLKIILNIFSRG